MFIMISESYKNRIKHLAGLLTEVDNRQKIMSVLGLPDSIANWAHELSDKYSTWIAHSFKNKYSDPGAGMTRTLDEKKMLALASSLNSNYRYILDWLQGRNVPPVRETDKINFKELTYDEALKRSEVWHKELKKVQGGQIKDEDGDVVMSFPDGFYWINLNKATCDKEAEAMGHCGRGRGKLYSLRRDKYPYVTADIEDGVINQMKGRGNTKPLDKYHPYILALLLNPKIGIKNFDYRHSYRSQEDFKISDLKPNEIEQIVYKKPSLILNQTFKDLNLSDKNVDYLIQNHPEVIPNSTILSKMDFAELESKMLGKEISIDGHTTNDFIGKFLKEKKFEDLIKTLNELGGRYEKLAAQALYENPDIVKYYFNLKKDKEPSNYYGKETYKEYYVYKYLEMLSQSGDLGKKMTKELGLNSDKLYNLFEKGKLLNAYIQILIKTEFFDLDGREFLLKKMKEPRFKEEFINVNGEQQYKILYTFVKELLNKGKKSIKK